MKLKIRSIPCEKEKNFGDVSSKFTEVDVAKFLSGTVFSALNIKHFYFISSPRTCLWLMSPK